MCKTGDRVNSTNHFECRQCHDARGNQATAGAQYLSTLGWIVKDLVHVAIQNGVIENGNGNVN